MMDREAMDQKSMTGGPTNSPDQDWELGGHHWDCSRVCIGECDLSREVTQGRKHGVTATSSTKEMETRTQTFGVSVIWVPGNQLLEGFH